MLEKVAEAHAARRLPFPGEKMKGEKIRASGFDHAHSEGFFNERDALSWRH